MSSYWGTDFFSFFQILISRIFSGFPGGISADEVQLFTLGLTSLACGLIGPFLVLKKMTMFANSLSHTILFGIAGAYLAAHALWGGGLFDATTLFIGAGLAAILTAIFTEGLTRMFRLQQDASIGVVFSLFFALGILLVTVYTKNVHIGVEVVMGNADVLRMADLKLAGYLAGFNAICVFCFYTRLQICSFDPAFAASLSIGHGKYHFLLLILSALTLLGAFRAVGVLLVLAFLVGPYLIARLFSQRLGALLIWTPMIGIGITAVGVALSRHLLSVWDLPLSTGGLVVTLIGIFYGVAVVVKRCKGFRLTQAT